MAFSKSVFRAQDIARCSLCENDPNVKWLCIECDFLMCITCRDEIHSEFKLAKDHTIIDIKNVGRIDFTRVKCQIHSVQTATLYCETCHQLVCVSCVSDKEHSGHRFVDIEDAYQANLGKLINKLRVVNATDKDGTEKKAKYEHLIYTTNLEEFFTESSTILKEDRGNFKMKVTRKFVTELEGCFCMAACSDGTFWIGDLNNKIVQKVKEQGSTLQGITSINTKVGDLKVLSDKEILLADESPTVRIINHSNGQISESIYNGGSLAITSIYVTSDNQVIVGAFSPVRERPVVIVMDQEGHHQRVLEHDTKGERLFSLPWRITCTKNKNIFVADIVPVVWVGRVLVLGQDGSILSIYRGNPDITDKPFKATDMTSTPSDRVIVCGWSNQSFHILNNSGHLLSYISGSSIGVKWPYCMYLKGESTLYIGTYQLDSKERAELYEVEFKES